MGKCTDGLWTFQAAIKLMQEEFIADCNSVLASTFSKGDTPLMLYIGSFCV